MERENEQLDPGQGNSFHTYVAYRDNNSWTSERGASKFLDILFKSGSLGKGDSGCVFTGFKVTANSPADMSVIVKADDSQDNNEDSHCKIDYDNYAYLGWMDSDYRLTLAGSSQSLNRISYVVLYIDRTVEFVEGDHIIESPSVMKIIEVPGSEASSPTPPTLTQIQSAVGINNPYIIIAEIRINANTAAINNSMITDRRIKASFSGDITMDPSNTWATGVYAADSARTKTRIVVTGPSASTPKAIPGVQLIWLRKKQ